MIPASSLNFAPLFLSVIIACLAACAGPSLRISTKPEAAQIFSTKGDLIGNTPLVLQGDAYKILKGDSAYLEIKISKEGFQEENLLVDAKYLQEISLDLNPADENYFNKHLLQKYSSSVSQLVRGFLIVQGAVASKKFDIAQSEMTELLKKYPNFAVTHALDGDLKLASGRKDEAIQAFRSALKLNPDDSKIRMTLEKLGVKP